MSHVSQSLKPSRRRLAFMLLAATAAAVALVFAMHSPFAKAETCVGGNFCAWTGSSYSGEERNLSCSGGTGTNFETNSAQNHCGVNVRIGWAEGGSTNWKACLAPGGLRPEPGRFNEIVPNGC